MNDVSRNVTGPPPEQEAIRAKCFHPTGTFVAFEKEEIEQSVPQRLEKISRTHPSRIAARRGTRLNTSWLGLGPRFFGIEPVGVHDNFLDLGGHSLAATRIVSQIIKKFN